MTGVDTPPAMARVATTPLEVRVWEALGSVMDPELDEPVTTLGFVQEWSVDDGVARVRLRLPTYFCAPNFVWMMVADAHDALSTVEGVVRVDVGVDDHFATSEIALTSDLSTSCGAHADVPDLDELRLTFRRKAYTAALDRVWRQLRRDGAVVEDLGDRCLADVPPSDDRDRLVRCRASLGLPTEPTSMLLLDETGEPISTADAELWLRRAQTVRVNIEGNAELCRGLLCSRYELGEHQAQIATPLSITPRVHP